VQGGGVRARSRECGGGEALDLGWLGTICRHNYVYVYGTFYMHRCEQSCGQEGVFETQLVFRKMKQRDSK
jgi:hypothetical protein